ncbi:hypothetical protein [Gordonia phthalatica]|uniref:Uncharacterized protein n=1 Tax=Gordonia phthalatica TaxID=1136941 RepID=A0A0N7FV67_9ACTN|nr:hypothetical protein [Gordonia phthalatica]ALG86311.1 hypothetical protein ACH46_19755 [Gordonia phthalatica]
MSTAATKTTTKNSGKTTKKTASKKTAAKKVAAAKSTATKSTVARPRFSRILASLADGTKDVVDSVIDSATDLENGTVRRVERLRDRVLPTDSDVQSIADTVVEQVERLPLVRKSA